MKAASRTERQEVQDEARGAAAPADHNKSFLDRAASTTPQRDDYLELLQRTAAEFEDFRKRIQREQTENQRYAHEAFVRELLPVVDNLQRALKSARQDDERSPLMQGLNAVESQLFDVFRRFGVVPIDPRGQRFDPNCHEAVVYEPSAEVAPGNISSVLEAGYQLHERILRPARIVVAAPPGEWLCPGEEPLLELIRRIAATHEILEPAQFPKEFADYNDVELDYVLVRLIEEKRLLADEIGRCLKQLADRADATRLAEEALASEASILRTRLAVVGIPVMRAMITEVQTLAPDDPLSMAAKRVVAGFQQDFPVVNADRLIGILTRVDLMAGLSRLGPEGRVRDVMQSEFVTAHPRDMLQTALERLQNCNCHTLPVVDGGQLVGVVTADNLAQVLMIQDALQESRDGGGTHRTHGKERNGQSVRVSVASSPASFERARKVGL